MLIEQNFYLPRKIKEIIPLLSNSYPNLISKVDETKKLILENCRLKNYKEEIVLTEKISNLINANFNRAIVIGIGGAISASIPYVSCFGYHSSKFELIYSDSIDIDNQSNIFTKDNLKNSAVIVISRSGESVETLSQLCEVLNKYKLHFGDQYKKAKHFFIISQGQNTLTKIGESIGARIFDYSSKSGKFSAFSMVGLLPAKLIDLNVKEIINGAIWALEQSNVIMESAWINFQLMQLGYNINVLSHYDSRLEEILNWFSQISSEITAKDGKGSTSITTNINDQHGAWQLFIDGPNDKYFTLLRNKESKETFNQIPQLIRNTYHKVNKRELIRKQVPVREIVISALNCETLGFLRMKLLLEAVFLANFLGVPSLPHLAIEKHKKMLSKICSASLKEIIEQII